MKQKLIKDFETYTRMKNIATKSISSSCLKFALSKTSKNIVFNHFMNDDIKDADSFKDLLNFLHHYYFSRLT